MATQESLPLTQEHLVTKVYIDQEDVIDQLERAVQSVSKFPDDNLSDYTEPDGQAYVAEQSDTLAEVLVHPACVEQNTAEISPGITADSIDGVKAIIQARKAITSQREKADELKLIKKAQHGDEKAMEKLWLDAQRMATIIAKTVAPNVPILEDDLLQIGLEQVPGVIQRYDSSKGSTLSSRLYQRMRGAILDAQREYAHANGLSRSDYAKIKKALKSDDPGASLHALTQSQRTSDGSKQAGLVLAPHLVDEDRIVTTHRSLDALISVDTDGAVTGIPTQLAAETDVMEEVMQICEAEQIDADLRLLSEREREVITRHYGLKGEQETLTEIGHDYGVTVSRMSHILASALEKLRIIRGTDQEESLPPLQNRLKSIEVQPRGLTNSRFRQRIHDVLNQIDDSVLSDEEVSTVLNHLPNWHHIKVKVGGSPYQFLRREGTALPTDTIITLEEDDSNRCVIGLKQGLPTILLKEIQGKDLKAVLNIEKRIQELPIKPRGDVFGKLHPREVEVLSNLWLTNQQMAIKMSIKDSSVRSHIANLMRPLGLHNDADLLVLSVREGMTSLDTIPAKKTSELSKREEEIVRDCYNMIKVPASKYLGISPKTYGKHWENIYKKTGAVNHRQVILMAMRDGLIPMR